MTDFRQLRSIEHKLDYILRKLMPKKEYEEMKKEELEYLINNPPGFY